ncbi:hypothetical protein F5Y18DRAFT_428147 [Xylariaceae sp. FL1019]|nr:hypothetical protein F5Y18DRAFT_428147 [Xylariaceae sp. FL1019]
MKITLSISLLLAAASAMPSPNTRTYCGPSSNCEIVNNNGTVSYRFKDGMEPGSADYKSRFSSHSKRQDGGPELKVVVGETKIQWGCGVDVKGTIRDAIAEHCTGNGGACDSGTPSTLDTTTWTSEYSEPEDGTLSITVMGSYLDQDTLDLLSNATQAVPGTDGAVEVNEMQWAQAPTGSGGQWGQQGTSGSCTEMIFPNYVSVNRFDDGNLRDMIEIDATLTDDDDDCLGEDILAAIVGALNPWAGALFSTASAVCGSSSDA